MLQQTRVSVVVPYYERFLERFPTAEALAAAKEEEVLALWSGLGYYRRARHLHAAARQIVVRHGGEFPRPIAAVRELPGVGRYTAGAVASIAFGEAAPVVDGNVARVLARWLGVAGDPKSAEVSGKLWTAASRLVDPEHPGDFNQAVMELGAMICTPSAPECPGCPLRRSCRARAEGRQSELPTRARRVAPRIEPAAVVALRRSGSCLLVRRDGAGLMQGLWELPGDGGGGDGSRLAAALRRRHRLWVEIRESLGEVRHSILDRRIHLAIFRGRLTRPPRQTAGRDGWRWARPAEAMAGSLPLSGAARKVLRALGTGDR
jgi:A/G-specific adenine glycosylase